MAPRAQVPAKNLKNEPPRGDAPTKNLSARGVKKKDKKEKKKKVLKLKGWLETPADWARFNAWAKINAQPRKIPELEPIVRASKPLAQMKKRISILSKPVKKPRPQCRRDIGVSKKALTAKPSKRIKIIARHVEKKIDHGREFPIKISRAALRYRASKRIIEISQPHEILLSEECKSLMEMTKDFKAEKQISRKTRLALARKVIHCPDLLTDEELDVIMTPTGIYRSALSYKFTPWMKYLSLPSYRFLRYQDGETPTEWKKYILEENESRGKRALAEKRRRQEKKLKIQEDKEEISKVDEDKTMMKEEKSKDEIDEESPVVEVENEETPMVEEASEENKEEASVADEEKEEKAMTDEKIAETNEAEENIETKKEDSEEKKEDLEKKKEDYEKKDDLEKKKEASLRATKRHDNAKKDEEDSEEAARRKAEKNAWRFAPPPCKDDPFAIKRSALKGKVSPRMAELALPSIHKDRSCRKDPFGVKKSALTGPIPEGVSRLAKPNHPRDPIEKPPPREKDSFGRPIYPIPEYGKKMPRVKPFKPADCPDKEKKAEDEEVTRKEKKEKKKRQFIDPIVYEPTIDPLIDPERSKRQIKARKAAKEELNRIKEAKEAKEPKEAKEAKVANEAKVESANEIIEEKIEKDGKEMAEQKENDDNDNESPEIQNNDAE